MLTKKKETYSPRSSTSSFERAMEQADIQMTKNKASAYNFETAPYVFDEEQKANDQDAKTSKQVI